jgi:hypothetical protein
MLALNTFRMLYCKVHIQFLSWLGCYHELASYVATFHTCLKNFQCNGHKYRLNFG